MPMNKHIGSSLESFLEEEGMLEDANLFAQKMVISESIRKRMLKLKMTKTALAKKMKTSRTEVDRILDPDDPSMTLSTLAKVASALGLQFAIGVSPKNTRRRAA